MMRHNTPPASTEVIERPIEELAGFTPFTREDAAKVLAELAVPPAETQPVLDSSIYHG